MHSMHTLFIFSTLIYACRQLHELPAVLIDAVTHRGGQVCMHCMIARIIAHGEDVIVVKSGNSEQVKR